LTYARNPADPESTGALVISVFHQFVGGKSGSGPGSPASRRGAIAVAMATCTSDVQEAIGGTGAARRKSAAIRPREKCELLMLRQLRSV